VANLKVIDLKPYFTDPKKWIAEQRQFWKEHQTSVTNGLEELMGEGRFDFQSTFTLIDNAIVHADVHKQEQCFLIIGRGKDFNSVSFDNTGVRAACIRYLKAEPKFDQLFHVVYNPKQVEQDKQTMLTFNLNRFIEVDSSDRIVFNLERLHENFLKQFGGEHGRVVRSFINDITSNPEIKLMVEALDPHNRATVDLVWKEPVTGENWTMVKWNEYKWNKLYSYSIQRVDFRVGVSPIATIKEYVNISLVSFMNAYGGFDIPKIDAYVKNNPAYENFTDREKDVFDEFKVEYSAGTNNRDVAAIFGHPRPPMAFYLVLGDLDQDTLGAYQYCLAGKGFYLIAIVVNKQAAQPASSFGAYAGGQFGYYDGAQFNQQSLHPQDQWPHVNNDMLIELLNHYALTQVLVFPENAPRQQLPQGMDLLKLVQLRLGADRMHRGIPGMPGFNHMHSRVHSYGPDMFNQPLYRTPQGGIFSPDPYFPPTVTNGRYARHPRTGAWTWYPEAPFNIVYSVDKSSISPRDRTRELIAQIAKTLDEKRPGTGRAIDIMMEEITFALNNHEEPKVLELLSHDKVILFVGGPLEIDRKYLTQAYGSFSNWILLPSEIDPEHPKAGVAGIARATHMPQQKLPDSFY